MGQGCEELHDNNEVVEDIDEIEENEHIIHLPEPLPFDVDDDYDFLRHGLIQTVWYYTLRTVAHIILSVTNRVMFGVKIRGMRNLRAVRGTGAVVVANHVHVMDCTLIDSILQCKRMYYTTLETNFRIPMARHLIRWLGGVPIPQNTGSTKRFLQQMRIALDKGHCVCVYPETVLHPYYDGKLRRFKEGAFKIALMSDKPVLPIVISFREPRGVYKLYKKRRPCVTVRMLPPVYAPECSADGNSSISARAKVYAAKCRDIMEVSRCVDMK